MIKRLIGRIKIIFYEIKKAYQFIIRFVRTNLLINRLFFFLLLSVLTVGSIFLGHHHKAKDEYIKAMTVSDINQTIEFSKTGAKLKLEPQKRNKDLTVIPFRLENTESQSLDSKDYLVSLMPIQRKSLGKNINTSVLFFGVNGEGALVIKGKLPKEPINVIIRNDSKFTSSNSGDGKILINGVEQEVDYNGVSFTINPKGNNVKQDKTINKDMRMSDLYTTSFAKNQMETINKNYKKSVKKENNKRHELNEYAKRVKKMNKTLNRDENDMKYDNTEENTDNEETTISTTDLDDAQSSSDISNTDLENYRNSALDKMANIKDEIENEEDTQKGLNTQAKQLEAFVKDKVFDLTSMSSRTEIRQNDKIK